MRPVTTAIAAGSGGWQTPAVARTDGELDGARGLIERVGLFDLHIDSYIWTRILRYDLLRRHGPSVLGRRFLWHTDLPRAVDAGVSGGIWSVTTNPFRPAAQRRDACVRNVAHLHSVLRRAPGVRPVRTVAQYRAARAVGDHGAFVGIQGGNALAGSVHDLDLLDDGDVVRVTLVHLTNSRIGGTSAPLRRPGAPRGLTSFGRDYVRACQQRRILVDLAHISPDGFTEAVAVSDPAVPLAVTHTGVDGVHDHWRNLSDAQIRSIARTGGCVGVMLNEAFLGRPTTVATVADHLDHLVRVGGEDVPAIGTDYDGMVTPPPDLAGYDGFPRLVAELARRGWTEDRIAKALSGNALRTLEAVRG